MRTHIVSTTFYSTQIQDRCTIYDDRYENVHLQNVLLPSCLFPRFPARISLSLSHHIIDSVLSVLSESEFEVNLLKLCMLHLTHNTCINGKHKKNYTYVHTVSLQFHTITKKNIISIHT